MTRHLRLSFLAAALAAGGAHAQLLQTQIGVSPALQVQSLAPQLVSFAGGDVNFQNLVNGLALGLPVTLTTPLAAGLTQVVSFTPVGTMTAGQIAQTLESARQVAIANGIATPTAQQLGAILGGGALPTAAGTTTVNGLIAGTTTVNSAAAGASVATQLQSTPTFARSDSPMPRGVADTPLTPPGTGVATGTPTGTTPGTASSLEAPRLTPGAGAGATAPAVPAGVRRDR